MWLGLLPYTRLYRAAFFTGPFGTGKTLGAVALAVQLVSEFPCLKVLSNLPISSTDILEIDNLCNSVIILDEGRRYLDARKWASKEFNIDYLRHLNSFLVVSAAFDVDARLRRLTVERIFPFLSLPVWFYRVRLHDDTAGRLAALLLPQSFWGMYPRRYMMSSEEDYFYTLVDEFFSQLSYVPARVSDEHKEKIAAVVQSTISAVRQGA